MSKKLYQTLELQAGASSDEVKRAYRKLAKKYHPDVNKGDASVEKKFKEISAAYAILSNTEKKAKYDRGEIDDTGADTFHGFRPGSGGFGSSDSGQSGWGGGGFDPSDLFSDLFNSGGRRQQQSKARSSWSQFRDKQTGGKGSDVLYTLSVSFVEAALGGKSRLKLNSGKEIEVTIPAACEDGQKLKLKGQGQPNILGQNPGDGIVEIRVGVHKIFVRKGLNIESSVLITLPEAVLGGKIKVETIHGKLQVKIPAGSNTDDKLKLTGKGIKLTPDKTGNHIVSLKVVLPKEIDSDLQKFVEKWSQKHPYST